MQLKSKTWETLEIFPRTINGKNIELVDSPLEMPDGLQEVVSKSWDEFLRKQKEKIPDGEIKPYHENPSLNALYVGDRAEKYPGPAISLKKFEYDETGNILRLYVGQTSFPFAEGLDKNPEISKLYEEQGIPKPRPPLAICVYPITKDGKIILTVRGERANNNRRYHGVTGNPRFTRTTVIEHEQEELAEEIFVNPDDYDSNKFEFAGLVIDMESEKKGKPDMVGWIPVNLTSDEVIDRVRKTPPEKRQKDAVGVVRVSADEEALHEYLTKGTHYLDFSPPAQGGLVLYALHQFGEGRARKILEEMWRD